VIYRTGLRGSPSWQGACSEAGYVHADRSVPDTSTQLADGAGHTFPLKLLRMPILPRATTAELAVWKDTPSCRWIPPTVMTGLPKASQATSLARESERRKESLPSHFACSRAIAWIVLIV
jgi:hypothetical protein